MYSEWSPNELQAIALRYGTARGGCLCFSPPCHHAPCRHSPAAGRTARPHAARAPARAAAHLPAGPSTRTLAHLRARRRPLTGLYGHLRRASATQLGVNRRLWQLQPRLHARHARRTHPPATSPALSQAQAATHPATRPPHPAARLALPPGPPRRPAARSPSAPLHSTHN